MNFDWLVGVAHCLRFFFLGDFKKLKLSLFENRPASHARPVFVAYD